MPCSSIDGKRETVAFITSRFPPSSQIVDVGPGAGVYAQILRPLGYGNIDAVEIYAPYVQQYGLRNLYRQVNIADICCFRFDQRYDLAILGDVLEHIEVRRAQSLLGYLRRNCGSMIISIPWQYSQETYQGNEFEKHLQPDLTPELARQRYPGIEPIYEGPKLGVYHLPGSPV